MKVTVLYAEAGVGTSVVVETDEGQVFKLDIGSSYTLGDEVELHLDGQLIHESNHKTREVIH